MTLRNALLHGFLKLVYICCVCLPKNEFKMEQIASWSHFCQSRCAGGPIIHFLMGTSILMHSNSTSWNPPITYNSLNNIDFAMKRWMKPDWVIFQLKFSGFCKNPVDLVQLVGTFFLVCPLSDNRQAIDQCLIWNPITLQGEQTMSLVCQSIWIHPSKTRFYKSLGQFQPTSRVQNIAVSHITILQFIMLLDNFSGCRTVNLEEKWMHYNFLRCSFQPLYHP